MDTNLIVYNILHAFITNRACMAFLRLKGLSLPR